tara:strand:+ start:75 stop:1046 length:972 start_codon:yes stop_codon:yes gene_type:complete
MAISLASISKQFDIPFEGNGDASLDGVCGLSDNRSAHLSFIAHAKYLSEAENSDIPCFVTRPDLPVAGKSMLIHEHPEWAIAQISRAFAPSQLADLDGISAHAVIDESATLGDAVSIGANVVIGKNVTIGARTKLFPNVVVMDRCRLGDDCVVYPNCTIREDSELGDRVILQPGVSIGGDGYGFVLHEGRHEKIPQLGRVVLQDDVEVGANSTIDRARFSETRVGRGTKIDNLVMLAHNVVTGEDCLLVSQVGVSGSTRLGDRVTLAGQVGTVGHVNVTDDVTVLGKGGITKDIGEAGVYAGMPLKPARLWRRAMARLYAGLK